MSAEELPLKRRFDIKNAKCCDCLYLHREDGWKKGTCNRYPPTDGEIFVRFDSFCGEFQKHPHKG